MNRASARELKARRREVPLVQRAEDGHSTNYDDARAILEFIVQNRN